MRRWLWMILFCSGPSSRLPDRPGGCALRVTDVVLCAEAGNDAVRLCLAGVHRRGHSALCDAVNAGRIEVARLRQWWRTRRYQVIVMGGSGWPWT